ncbi:MAG: CDP-glycerol glycerophosphotransferase family protein [Candidatus Heimdallarchaeota archaeon]|nr:MAG: CDP-glycerol glycerophosphotransferase family protein [Candidatus Heimdallarchaeota archaeon]
MDNRDKFFTTLITTKLSCGKNLLELTIYKDLTLWWFIDNHFQIFLERIFTKKTLVSRSQLHLIPLFRIFELLFYYLKVFLINTIIKLIGKKSSKNKPEIRKVLIINQDIQWKYIQDYKKKQLRKTDAFFDSIINQITGQYELIGTYPLKGRVPIRSSRVFIEKLKSNISHFPFDRYWSIKSWREEIEAARHFKKVWNVIKEDKIFKQLTFFEKKKLHKAIETELEFYFSRAFPRSIRQIEMAKQLFEKETPNLVLLLNEYGFFERTFVYAGKKEKIPTIALQHGIIHPTHYAYMINKRYKGSVLLPDITCVYGYYFRDLLVNKSVYEPKQVVVTGSPRYDIFIHGNNLYSKEKLGKKFKTSPREKIILWATQCQLEPYTKDLGENRKNFDAVFGTFYQLKDTLLIIKQHPGEGIVYTKMIEEYLNKYHLEALFVPKNADTFELLYCSDLLITKNSTTAMEAIALNKPVLILNLSGQPDIVNYVEEGVAIGVYSREKLKSAVERLLNDDSELVANRERYIENYLYQVDGKATKRVVDQIDKLCA